MRRLVLFSLVTMVAGLLTNAVQAGNFQVTGTATQEGRKGNVYSGVISGLAAPGGRFTGTFAHKATRDGGLIDGIGVLDFGAGDTLTIAYLMAFNAESKEYEGVYVVTEGTGKLAGATGSGDMLSGRGAEVQFELDGTLEH